MDLHKATSQQPAAPPHDQQPAGQQRTGPQEQQPTGQQWPAPWPPYAPPHKHTSSWLMPVAIIAAAVLIAGGAIAVALINKSGSTAPGHAPSAAAPPGISVSDASSSTCNAWRSTKAALDNAGDPLPDGWNWDTPGIDGMIEKNNAIITSAMNLFEPQIAPQPADAAAAAHAYVKARRNEVAKFSNHTYTEADGIPVTSAFTTLNQLCHVAG